MLLKISVVHLPKEGIVKNFGFSGIWEHPQSTVPGLVAGMVGICVAMGWIPQEYAGHIAAAVPPIIIAVIGILYKGQKPCPAGLPPHDYYNPQEKEQDEEAIN